jgi:toxin ParE1/3/4
VKIEWSFEALRDLDQIQDYLEQHSPRAAKRMWLRIHERVELQAEIPLAAPLYRDGPARMLVVRGTPYIVMYVVESDVLKVEQVIHAARDR